jgi:hypothetical protein
MSKYKTGPQRRTGKTASHPAAKLVQEKKEQIMHQ